MSSKANMRMCAQPWTRRVLGLFAAVWLNLALQPCAMAMEPGDHDCPHCPPKHEQQMAAHHGHGANPDQPPCESLQADCGDIDDVSLDGRTGKFKVKDAGELPVFVAAGIPGPFVRVVRQARCPTGPPLRTGSSPPLHVLHCVYLK